MITATLPHPKPVPAQVYRYDGPLGQMTLRCLDDHRHFRVLFHSPSAEYVRKAPVEAESMSGWMVHVTETAHLVPA